MNETNTKELYELLEEKRTNKEDYSKKLAEGLSNFSSNYIDNPTNETPKSETPKEPPLQSVGTDSFLNTTIKILAERNLLEKGLGVLEKLASNGKLNINNYTQNTGGYKYVDMAGFDITKQQYDEEIKRGRADMVRAIPVNGTPMVVNNEVPQQPVLPTQPTQPMQPQVTPEEYQRLLKEKEDQQIMFAKSIIFSYSDTLKRVSDLNPDIKISDIIPPMLDELESCIMNGDDFVRIFEKMHIKDEKPKQKTRTKAKKKKEIPEDKSSNTTIIDNEPEEDKPEDDETE